MSNPVKHNALPGFGITMGYAVTYLSLIVLLPLAALLLKTAGMDWSDFWRAAFSPRVLASYRLTFGAALVAALINAVFGFVVAWSLVRYRFPGRRLVDAMVDLPFALPTAVLRHRPDGDLRARTVGSASTSRRWASRSRSLRWASWPPSRSSACPSWSGRCSPRWPIWTAKPKRPPPAWAQTGCRLSSR